MERIVNIFKPKLPRYEVYCDKIKELWETHHITNNGKFVIELEERLGELFNRNIILTSNGTSALDIMCNAFELSGEVITTPFTFAATTNVLVSNNLKPVFADINEHDFNIDVEEIESLVTDKTSAILATHVYGAPCDTSGLRFIADKYNLKILYDAAHCFGVETIGTPVASFGDASAFSFHAVKGFSTVEGGAIVTSYPRERFDLLRNFGIEGEDSVVLPGLNAKMSEFHAIFGLCSLETFEDDIKYRKKLSDKYLSRLEWLKMQRNTASKQNYVYFPVLFKNKKFRDRVYKKLAENGVGARKYFYPLTCDFAYFDNTSVRRDFKVARNVANTVLCLPIHNYMSLEDVDYICDIITY